MDYKHYYDNDQNRTIATDSDSIHLTHRVWDDRRRVTMSFTETQGGFVDVEWSYYDGATLDNDVGDHYQLDRRQAVELAKYLLDWAKGVPQA